MQLDMLEKSRSRKLGVCAWQLRTRLDTDAQAAAPDPKSLVTATCMLPLVLMRDCNDNAVEDEGIRWSASQEPKHEEVPAQSSAAQQGSMLGEMLRLVQARHRGLAQAVSVCQQVESAAVQLEDRAEYKDPCTYG